MLVWFSFQGHIYYHVVLQKLKLAYIIAFSRLQIVGKTANSNCSYRYTIIIIIRYNTILIPSIVRTRAENCTLQDIAIYRACITKFWHVAISYLVCKLELPDTPFILLQCLHVLRYVYSRRSICEWVVYIIVWFRAWDRRRCQVTKRLAFRRRRHRRGHALTVVSVGCGFFTTTLRLETIECLPPHILLYLLIRILCIRHGILQSESGGKKKSKIINRRGNK